MDWSEEESKERLRKQQERTKEGGSKSNQSRANETRVYVSINVSTRKKNECLLGDFCGFLIFVKGRVCRPLPYRKMIRTYPRTGGMESSSEAGRGSTSSRSSYVSQRPPSQLQSKRN